MPRTETVTCTICGTKFTYVRGVGRPPKYCPDDRQLAYRKKGPRTTNRGGKPDFAVDESRSHRADALVALFFSSQLFVYDRGEYRALRLTEVEEATGVTYPQLMGAIRRRALASPVVYGRPPKGV